MDDGRIPTELWVGAVLRRCVTATLPAYVLRRGAAAAGTVLVKVVLGGGRCRLQSQTRDMDGALVWSDVFDDAEIDETKADAYIGRTTTADPDLWVVEVEDKTGKNPFDGN